MTREELKGALKPIAQGLFGRQGARPLYERPNFPLRPLERMLSDLREIPFEEWYSYVFSRDPINGKYSEAQRREWMEKGIACGREYADRIAADFGTRDARAIAGKMGLEVSFPEMPEKTERVLFAEYRSNKRICIYMDALNRAGRYLKDEEVRGLVGRSEDIIQVLLGHELFHRVEDMYAEEIFTRTERIRLWKVGPLHNDSTILSLSEIAAMAFGAHLTGYPAVPYVLDMFLVYGYSPQEASGLYEEMMEFAGREPFRPGAEE